MDSNVGPYDQLVRTIGICPIYMLIDGSSNGTRAKSDGSNHCPLQ
jgi:hypothetical protein